MCAAAPTRILAVLALAAKTQAMKEEAAAWPGHQSRSVTRKRVAYKPN